MHALVDYPRKGRVQGHVTFLNLGKEPVISQKRCKIDTQLHVKTNRKSYEAYRMAPLQVTFSDLEGHFCCSKPLCPSAAVVRGPQWCAGGV